MTPEKRKHVRGQRGVPPGVAALAYSLRSSVCVLTHDWRLVTARRERQSLLEELNNLTFGFYARVSSGDFPPKVAALLGKLADARVLLIT